MELCPIDSMPTSQNSLTLSYSRTAPKIGPDDIYCLDEASLDNQNVGSQTGQTNSIDNDHATYIAQDRRGLGQTFTTGHKAQGYAITGFWLKHVKYKRNLSEGDGSWWYIRAQHRNGLIRFNQQQYGNQSRPCLVMHANLGITYDLQALRKQLPSLIPHRFDCQTGIADFEEAESCNMDFWILVDGQVRKAQRHVTTQGILTDLSIALTPTDRFLSLVTTDGGDPDHSGTLQRSYSGDWGIFIKPMLHFDLP